MNNADHISESLETILLCWKYLNSFADPGRENRTRMEKIRIWKSELKIKSNLRGRGDHDEAARLCAQQAGIGGQERGRELNPARQALQGGRRPSGQHRGRGGRDSSRCWRGGDETGICGKERRSLVGYFLAQNDK